MTQEIGIYSNPPQNLFQGRIFGLSDNMRRVAKRRTVVRGAGRLCQFQNRCHANEAIPKNR